ncbi:MAG: FAS1-like dehydratase domain-containing protein [Alkalilacustris sp.]
MDGEFAGWVGRIEEDEDVLTPRQARAMAATLGTRPCDTDAFGGGDPVPPLWHWMAFAPIAPMDGLGPDGHPARGGFLPPVPLERRMWAGGRVRFTGPALRFGEPLRRRSEILKVAEKSGATGRMVFVTVGHRLSTPRGVAIEEEQDIVYIAMPTRYSPPPPVPVPDTPAWTEDLVMSTVRLFRFSALTFNGHRIHYDLDYAARVERYPALVVHGPLQAMLTLEAARRRHPDRTVSGFTHRGVRPLLLMDTPRILAIEDAPDATTLCTATAEGYQCMQTRVIWNEKDRP